MNIAWYLGLLQSFRQRFRQVNEKLEETTKKLEIRNKSKQTTGIHFEKTISDIPNYRRKLNKITPGEFCSTKLMNEVTLTTIPY